jgi:hypothetical protein
MSSPAAHVIEADRPQSPAAAREARKVGRPSTAAPLAPRIVQWLDTEPQMSSAALLSRAREAGYRGGKIALYDLVRRLRRSGASARPLALLPGMRSRHEFARVGVVYSSGGAERLYFLASRLEWSQFLDMRVAPDRSEAGLVRCLLASFEAFGGVPLVAVWRHARFVARSCEGQLVNWNPLFAQIALDYRFAPELDLLRSRAGGGAAAPGVSCWVKDAFFRTRPFRDRADVEGARADWLAGVTRAR